MMKLSWRVTTCLLMTVWAAYPLVAQQPASSVMAGAKLRVEFMSEVGTAISRTNDGVQARLIKPLEAEGREAVPAGTVLSGRVLAVRALPRISHADGNDHD